MISDIKVNYAIIGDLRDKIATYKSAIETMEESLNNINSRLETENSGEAVAALISKHEDLKGDISACKGELEDLYKLFSGFHDEMTGIIHPMSYGALMRVDRDDIWWNMQSIIGACTGIGIIRYNVSTYRSFPSFSDSKEEKENQERNYRKIEEIWDIINSYKSGFDFEIDYMNNLFNSKVVPYEEMDNNYASMAHETYTRYVTTWERIVDGITDFYQGVANFVDGVIKSVEDLIKGLVGLIKGVFVYAVGAVAVVISKVTGDTPDWLKGAEEDFYKDNEMIKAVLDDPSTIVEGIAQQISDAKDEKGLAYCTGYTAGLIAQMVLLKKVKGGSGAGVVEKGPYSGEEWYNYLKKAYGEDNVDWASGKYKANDISTEFDYYVSQRYIDSHIELYEKYFGLKDSGLSHKEINNKLLDNYLDSRISDSGGWFTDKNANEVKSAMEQAYNNSNNIDTTISKELFYDIKNELIPYEPEKQFPNAYKIYKEKFFNSNSLGAIINNGIRKKIEFEWNAWGREGLNGKKSALYVLNYDDAKAISETCLNSKEIAIKLGLAEDTYSDGVWLGKIDPTAVENIRISTANELGANEWWVPGLRTSGGQYETVISRIENIDEAIDKKIVYFEKIKK